MEHNSETIIRVKRILKRAANNDTHKENEKAKTMLSLLNNRIRRGKNEIPSGFQVDISPIETTEPETVKE